MPIRAYKIKTISKDATFELSYESPLWDALEELNCLNGLGEAGGLITIEEADLKEMEGKVPDETIARIEKDLDPEFGYVIYYCY